MEATKKSFNWQWGNLAVDYSKDDLEAHRDQICKFTELPRRWFRDKKVIDVGCGGGRYTWGLCSLGCDVTAVDQSPNALKLTKKVCKDFKLKMGKIDILNPIIDRKYDLVWCFGVIHHTGDTRQALTNVASLVKDRGYLFLTVYGTPGNGIDMEEEANYERLRKEVADLTFDERVKYIKENITTKPKKVHGYFDAISTEINDLYTFGEVGEWLKEEEFEFKLTNEHRHHHIIARKND